MSQYCVVLDSNVYISAFLFGGHPRTIIERIVNSQITGAVSMAILDEVREVLRRPKFGLTDEGIMVLIAEIQDACIIVTPTETVCAVANDPDDDRVLECALAAKAEVIITGDAHLLALEQWCGISICSPSIFVKQLKQKPTGP